MIAWLDGEWIEEEDATISVRDRGFLFADGVFETALLYRGQYLRLRQHLDRLAASATLMGVPSPATALLEEIATDIANRNALTEGSLRITVTSGGGGGATVLVTISPRAAEWIARAREGWSVITASTRRPSTAAIPAQLKALGRTYALLARREAKAAAVDDALLLTDDGTICEGPSWNVFWRTGDVIYTPALDVGVLAGVTRSMVLEAAVEMGHRTLEGAFPRAALDRADEIFATMTSVGVVPVRRLDGRVLPLATPAADALYERYWVAVATECAPTAAA